ncbi:MAG: orotidine-5'-phosphate decarboxylase [bacterium]|nr:orotidine-5'-phosphate decarboxylase [bacterium]
MTQLIAALDVATAERAAELACLLAPQGAILKVGYEALYGYHDAIRASLRALRARIFVDAKLSDIPRTVTAGIRALVEPGVEIIDVHALGGLPMMRAAVEGAAERAAELTMERAPKVFAVTILTSLEAEELDEIGLGGRPEEHVLRLAALAQTAGCAGVVCSALEVPRIKAACGSAFEALCPGIRPAGADRGDQRRVVTPGGAVELGADYIVVGRPITAAPDPAAAARAILDELRAGAAPRLPERSADAR